MTERNEPPRPWPETYWLPGHRVLCGEYPGALDPEQAQMKLAALAASNVSVFVDLTTKADRMLPYEPLPPVRAIHRFPIKDMSVPDRALMSRILDAIDAAVANGDVVYVHCWGGVGRTGTVAGCWLVRRGATPREALDEIAKRFQTVAKSFRHRGAPETAEQRRFVLEWDESAPPSDEPRARF